MTFKTQLRVAAKLMDLVLWAILRGAGAPESGHPMDIDLGEKVKPFFPKTQFDWYVSNGITEFLKLSGKGPGEKGSRKATYEYSSIDKHIRNGFNIGVVLPPGVVIIDVDTRKNGFANFDRLCAEAYKGEPAIPTLDDLVKSTFTVRSGGGGLHLYFKHDPGKRVRGSIRGCDGVDLKSSNAGYVVAPGSVHPGTGRIYTIENHPEALAELPEALAPYVLDSIRNPLDKKERSDRPHPLWGIITANELGVLLAALNPKSYREYLGDDKAWINIMSASSHATGGDVEAMQVFADWSASDPDYAGEAHKQVEKRWSGFHERRNAGQPVATVGSLLAAVASSSREAKRLGGHDNRHAKADERARTIRHRIDAAELEVIDDGEAPNMRAYIAALDAGWYSRTPALLHELAEKISELPDDRWSELAAVLSESMGREQPPLQVERLIRKKAGKRQKEEAKAKLTQAEIVDTAARRALKTMVPDSRDLLRPPKASFYIYSDGYWQRFPEEIVSDNCFNELEKFLDKSEKGLKPLPYYTREAFNQVSYMSGTESTALYDRKELPNCVNLKNGTLWFYEDGTYELKPHRREDYLTTRLPYSYDPGAECPSMSTMLEQVLDHVRIAYGEDEMRELIRHFWEFVGYTLSPKKDIAMIMFWLGEGHNGKSRIASIISNLFDRGSLLSTDLASLLDPSNKHGTASLEGKLLAMDDDVGENAEISDRIFKKICQSKLYDINPKNKDSRQIMLQTIVLLIANNGLKIIDTSPGFARRCYVIDFLKDISHLQNSMLPDIVDLMEMPGVLNEAIKGLSRLRKRGFFDVPKCAQDSKARFLVESNSALSFWESRDKTKCDGASTDVQELYDSYTLYMSSGGYGKAISKKAFVKALQRQNLVLTDKKIIGWEISITV